MLILNAGAIVGVLATFGVAVGAMVAGDGGQVDNSHSLERACAGLPMTRELEDTLSTERALTNDGSSQLCASVASDASRLVPGVL